MKTALILIGIAAALVALDRLGPWAEARGWVYWRRRKRTGSAAGSDLLDLDVFVDPGARHIVEVREAEPSLEITDDDIVPPPARRGRPG